MVVGLEQWQKRWRGVDRLRGRVGNKVSRLTCWLIKIHEFIHFVKIWDSMIDCYKTNTLLREKHVLFIFIS